MGSLIGGIAETQEMLDYCASIISSQMEVINMDYIHVMNKVM
jgi:D-arabinose 1-dehydrogenase-like Zn-dependent alcohol dehydrogenase